MYSRQSNFSTYSELSQSQVSFRKQRSRDEELKIQAYSKTYAEIARNCKCTYPCCENLTCNEVLTYSNYSFYHFILSIISLYKQQVAALRTDFWVEIGEKAYPSSKRNQNIQKLIYESYDEINNKFEFNINGKIKVCEGDIIILL